MEALVLGHVAESSQWDETRSGKGYKHEPQGWCVTMDALYARFVAWSLSDTGKPPKATMEKFLAQLRWERGLLCDGLVGPLTFPGGEKEKNRFTDDQGTQVRGYRVDLPALRLWLAARGVGKVEAEEEKAKGGLGRARDGGGGILVRQCLCLDVHARVAY